MNVPLTPEQIDTIKTAFSDYFNEVLNERNMESVKGEKLIIGFYSNQLLFYTNFNMKGDHKLTIRIGRGNFKEEFDVNIFDYFSVNDFSQVIHKKTLNPFLASRIMKTVGKYTLLDHASNNGRSSEITIPNSSVSGGSTYTTNNNQANSGNNANTEVNNVSFSVQRPEQSNIFRQQQQQVPGAPQMVFSASPIQYYPSNYLTQQETSPSMQLQQMSSYYSDNASGPIQAAGGQSQHIMISSASCSGGPDTPGLPPLHYAGVYADPCMYNSYSSAAVNANWQLSRSFPQQLQPQQSTDQQRGYDNVQNIVFQRTSSTDAANGAGGSWLTQQYTMNGAISTAYDYETFAGWIPGSQHVPSPQTNIPPQMNATYNTMFNPSQQPTYVHPNASETPVYYRQQSQP